MSQEEKVTTAEIKPAAGRGVRRGLKHTSRSTRAGLQFPVGRISRELRNGRYAARYACTVPVYMAGVLEYLTAELLELAGNAAREQKKQRLTPRHLQLAIQEDPEFIALLGRVTLSQGGVLPQILKELLPAKKEKQATE